MESTESIEVTGTSLAKFLDTRRPSPEDRLYAVVDAARNKELAFACESVLGEPMTSIFENPQIHMMDVIPYIVPIADGNRNRYDYLQLWAEALGTGSGVLVYAPASLDEMLTQARTMFFVEDEQGQQYYFRFYDPHVLRMYLPTCDARNTELLFGPISVILVEAEQPGQMLNCSRFMASDEQLEHVTN